VIGPDLTTIIRTALAASAATPNEALALHHAASARVHLERLRAELRELEVLVDAREEELVRRGTPRGQLALEGSKT